MIWSLSLPKFAFPQWVFQPGDPAWKSGIWSIWLYRNFGRDPESDDQEIPNPPEQVACIDAYGIVCQEATRFVRRYVKNLGLPEWYLKWFSDCASNASGSGFDNPFGELGVCWLLGMLPNRGQVFTGYEAVTDDLGVYSSRMLRALPVNRTNENHADDDHGDQGGDRDAVGSAALGAVVAGGLAGVMQAAVGTKSADRVTAIIRERVMADGGLRSRKADHWAAELRVTKKTVTDSVGWHEIMKWRAANRADRVSKKTGK